MEKEEFKLGELVLIEKLPTEKTPSTTNKRGYKYNFRGKFLCFCGTEFITSLSSVKRGETQSCGCYQRYKAGKSNFIDARSKTRLFRTYNGMKRRCYNKKDSSYGRYGGVGVTICQEWLDDFTKFREWALNNGYTDELTIDRVEGALIYSPTTCRWIPANKQSVNRGMFKTNKSGFRGVYRAETIKEGWLAKINYQGKMYNLGTYNTKIEAAIAYNKKASEFHGTEARLNVISSELDLPEGS